MYTNTVKTITTKKIQKKVRNIKQIKKDERQVCTKHMCANDHTDALNSGTVVLIAHRVGQEDSARAVTATKIRRTPSLWLLRL